MTTKYLALAAIGRYRPGLVEELSKAIQDNGCNIGDCRVTVLGEELALVMFLSGTWSAIAKMETVMPGLEKKLGLGITVRRTEVRAARANMLPYLIDITSIDRPGMIHDVAGFCTAREIDIDDLGTWTYSASTTGAPMCSVSLSISVPTNLHIGRLRDEFTDFCDQLNVDATLEPARR